MEGNSWTDVIRCKNNIQIRNDRKDDGIESDERNFCEVVVTRFDSNRQDEFIYHYSADRAISEDIAGDANSLRHREEILLCRICEHRKSLIMPEELNIFEREFLSARNVDDCVDREHRDRTLIDDEFVESDGSRTELRSRICGVDFGVNLLSEISCSRFRTQRKGVHFCERVAEFG